MIVTLIYGILSAVTIYIVIASYMLVRKSSSLIPVVPIAAIYYWSLFGVWSWIPMKLMGENAPVEEALLMVDIDDTYLLSVLYYSFFIIVFVIFELRFVDLYKYDNINKQELTNSYLQYINKLSDNKKYNAVVLFLLVSFVLLWLRDLVTAFSTGQSAYQVSRWDSSTGSMENLSMFMGNLFIVLAMPLLFAKNRRRKKCWVYAMIAIYFGMNFLLGNRSALLCGLALGIIMYVELYGTQKLFNSRNILIGIICLLGIQTIYVLRGLSIEAILSGDFSFNISDVFASLAGSGEKDAAQVSMYATLKKDVPFTYGNSFLFLLSTIFPSFLGFERPERVYTHYIEYVSPGGTEVGWTINHVTAWYINLGLIGIILGALFWAYVLGFFYKRRLQYIFMYGAALFSSSAISMIRDGGIECYKGALLMNTIIPIAIVWICLLKIKIIWNTNE